MKYLVKLSGAVLAALAGAMPRDALAAVLGIRPVGYRKDGRPVWPAAGGDGTALSQHIATLSEQQGTILKQMESIAEAMKASDATAERVTELKAQLDGFAQEMAGVTAQRVEAEKSALIDKAVADIAALKAGIRAPSKAGAIGTGAPEGNLEDSAGFFYALWAAKTRRQPGLNAWGKAQLEAMGSYWQDVPADSKATLGDTAAAGGNIVPAAVLTQFIEIQTAINRIRRLVTVTPVGFVSAVDVPTEGLAPTRAVVVGYGATKPNRNITANKYTATMYTIAEIYDVGNQLLRNSRGVAERNVRSRLSRAFALGESYYMLQGSGTNEPKGLLTSLGTSGQFVTSFTPSATTLAGSVARAVAKAAGDISNRAIDPTGAVVNAADFWTLASQGTDTAGFFLAPTEGPAGIDPIGLTMRIWGLDIQGDPNMPADNLVVGAFREAELFTGDAYRVDVSEEAGTRWDTNMTGFRGEEEIGFNADPYVATGYFQRITDTVP